MLLKKDTTSVDKQLRLGPQEDHGFRKPLRDVFTLAVHCSLCLLMVVQYCWRLDGLFLKLQDFIKSFEGRLLPVPREDMLAADTTEAACWVSSDKRMGKWLIWAGVIPSI